MTQDAVLEQVTRTIVERFHPKRIVLFGSHARGDAGSDSDLDVFIEMQTSRRPPERAIEVSAALDSGHGRLMWSTTHQKKCNVFGK